MPRYDFPAVSSRAQDRQATGEESWQETLYEYQRDRDWRRGEWGAEIGTVTITEDRSADRPPRFRATFAFGDGDTAEYSGQVPGDGSWQGRTTAQKDRGADRFRSQLDLDSTNPKRWG